MSTVRQLRNSECKGKAKQNLLIEEKKKEKKRKENRISWLTYLERL